jgi:hypothetical protein
MAESGITQPDEVRSTPGIGSMWHTQSYPSSVRSSRKRILWLGSIIALVSFGILYCLVNGPIGASPNRSPSLELPRFDTTDLGDGKIGEVLEGVIPIRNGGMAPLHFEVDPGCGCAYAKPTTGDVLGNQTERVRIGVRLDHEGAERNLRVRIRTNDANKPVAEHVLRARCPGLLQVHPQVADFGQVAAGSRATVPLAIRDCLGAAWDPAARKDLTFRCLSESADVEADPTSPTQLRVLVRLRAGVALGPVRGEVRFTLAGDNRELIVPILGEVCGPIQMAPANVRFVVDPKTGQTKKATVVLWRTDKGPLGRLTGVRKPAWLQVEDVGSAANVRRALRFELVGEPDRESAEQVVRLQFEGADEEVLVPIEARQREG